MKQVEFFTRISAQIVYAFVALLGVWLTIEAANAGTSVAGTEIAQAPAAQKRILILYPFNNNVPTLHQISSGVDAVVNKHNLQSANFLHEYLDIAPPKYKNQLVDLGDQLQKKYEGQHFDLIVTYGQASTNFLLNQAKELSPASPCLVIFGDQVQFTGTNGRTLTNIPLKLDAGGTLKLGLQLFPKTKNVIFVAGTSASDRTFEEQARTDFKTQAGSLRIEYTSDRAIDEVLKQVRNLPADTLVIYSNVSSDITGKKFVPRDVAKQLATQANAPVLSMFSTQIDTGVVGGVMTDMEKIGELIGNFMVSMNSGEPLSVGAHQSFSKPMLNWLEIRRWGGKVDDLPANSVIINRPKTLWEQYTTEVVAAITLIVVLSLLSGSLAFQSQRRKNAESAARESSLQLLQERDQLEQRVSARTAELSEALEFNETVLHHSPVPMGIYDHTGQCVIANDAYEKFVGASTGALIQQNFHEIESWKNAKLLSDCQESLHDLARRQGELNATSSFGKDVWFEYQIFPVHIKGQNHLLIQFIDLTQRKKMEEELRHFAFHDSLTRLPNRRLLIDRLKQAFQLSKRENSYLAVLFIDLDRFKQLNDNYGHEMGDAMLVEVAQRLQALVRSTDTVARLGGDEFIVLIPGLGPEQSKAAQYADFLAKKIQEALGTEFLLNGMQFQSSASVGMKLSLGIDIDPDGLLKEADDAMYEIKRAQAQLRQS